MKSEFRSSSSLSLTLGPASWQSRIISELMAYQPEYFRINFSHDTFETNLQHIRNLKDEFPSLPIYGDLKGKDQRFRLYPAGSKGISLQAQQKLVVFRDDAQARLVGGIHLPVDDTIRIAQVIALDDAKSHLVIREILPDRLLLEVMEDGYLKPNAGVTIDNETLSLPPIDQESLEHLQMLEPWIDGILVSHLRHASEVETIRQVFSRDIIAKIENRLAVDHLESIAALCPKIMIARGDLSMAYSPEEMPMVQETICRRLSGLPGPIKLYLATGFWESMQNHTKPSLAEITDVSIALRSGIRGFLLTAETAVGAHPVLAFSRLVNLIEHLSVLLTID